MHIDWTLDLFALIAGVITVVGGSFAFLLRIIVSGYKKQLEDAVVKIDENEKKILTLTAALDKAKLEDQNIYQTKEVCLKYCPVIQSQLNEHKLHVAENFVKGSDFRDFQRGVQASLDKVVASVEKLGVTFTAAIESLRDKLDSKQDK